MKVIIVTVLCLFSLVLFSQNNSDVRIAVHNVYVAPNYSKLPPIRPGFIGEMSFGEKLNGEKYWHYYYGFPTFYLSCFAGYPGGVEYGYVLGLAPQLSFDKILKNKWNYHIKTGFGIAYHTNPYDRKYNPTNMLIGSNICQMTNIEFGLSYEFQPNSYFGASIGLIHYSNGHVKLPNIGMNLPEILVFYKYGLKDDPKEIDYKYRDHIDKEWDWFINTGIGLHEFGTSTKPANGPDYKIYDIGFGLTKKVSPIHKYRIGVNLLYYESFNKFITYQEIDIGDPFLNSSVVGFFGAHEFLFGKFAFYSEVGIDIYKPFYRYSITMYGDEFTVKDMLKSINSNKLGCRYYFSEQNEFGLVAGINLKVNMAQADFVEIFCSFEF